MDNFAISQMDPSTEMTPIAGALIRAAGHIVEAASLVSSISPLAASSLMGQAQAFLKEADIVQQDSGAAGACACACGVCSDDKVSPEVKAEIDSLVSDILTITKQS
jgi:hypothetical protein